MNHLLRVSNWPIAIGLLILGCSSSDLGTTPQIPIKPSSIYSKKSLCLTGSSSVAGVEALQLIPDSPTSLPVTDNSFSFWIKMHSANPSGMIMSLDFSGLFLYVSWVGPTIEYRTFANSRLDVITTGVLVPTKWNHIVVNFNSLNPVPNLRKIIYVNGEISAQSTHFIDYTPVPGHLFQISPSSNYMSAGCLDDMYVWRRQITSTEVRELYGTGSPSFLSGSLVDVSAAWVMEQGPNEQTLADSLLNFNPPLKNGTFFRSNLKDPFLNPDLNEDPLNGRAPGDSQDSASNGSGVFDGGNSGFGGELGDGGIGTDGGLFP